MTRFIYRAWLTSCSNCSSILYTLENSDVLFIIVALWNRAEHYIFILSFVLLLLSFFPRLISASADWLSTWCGLSANLRCRSETCCTRLAENTGHKKSRQKSPSGHHCTTLSGYIFTTKAHIDNWKKLVKQQYVLHMSPQYGELRPTSGWDRFGSLRHPCKFQRVSRLGSITARHLVVGVSQTLWRWTEGATYVRQGDHHVGHWPTFWFNFVECFTHDKYTVIIVVIAGLH